MGGQLGSKSYGEPVVCDGVVYVGTNNEAHRDPKVTGDAGVLMAFEERDGRLLWQRASGKLAGGRVNDWPGEGLTGSVTVEGATHRLWYCTNRCEVVCLKAPTLAEAEKGQLPEVVWSVDMMGRLGVFPHNATRLHAGGVGERAYVITGNGVDDTHRNVVAPEAPSVVCLNKNTGEVVWTDRSPGKNILHGQFANLTVVRLGDEDVVIAPLGDGWVYGYAAETGKVLWKFDCNWKKAIYPQTRNELLAAPVVVGDRMYIANGQDPEHGEGPGCMWCVKIRGARGDISEELADRARNPNSGLAWHYSGVDRAHDGLKNMDAEAGDRMNRTMATAAVDEKANLVIVSDFSGFIHCLDARWGNEYWVSNVESPMWGSPLLCDGKVYQGSEDGYVRVFTATRTPRAISEHDMGSPVYSNPVIANGTLYIMTRDKLYAIGK